MDRNWLKIFIIDSELINHSSFTAKDKFVLKQYLSEGKSIDEIAKIAQVSSESIQIQIEKSLNNCKYVILDLLLKKRKLNQVIDENESLKKSIPNGLKNITPIVDVNDIQLSVRAKNAMLELGVQRIEELANYSKEDLLSIKNLGKKTVAEIFHAMENFGIKFKNSKD